MILSRSRMSVGISVLVEQNFDVIKNLSRYGVRPIFARSICTNGPAIWGGCVTRRKHPGRVLVPQREQNCHGARRVWHSFCRHGTNFIDITGVSRYKFDRSQRTYHGVTIWWRALAQCRGTNCLGARNLSRCRILIAGRCACPGATNHYEFVLGAGAKAKTVTNNLPILSVLGVRYSQFVQIAM